MAITIAARSIDNIRSGAATVYIADGGQIESDTSWADNEITLGELSTLLGNCHYLGEMLESPGIKVTPDTVEQIFEQTPKVIFADVQISCSIDATIKLAEMDNSLFYELIEKAENNTKVDLLWLRSEEIDDYISFIGKAPFSIAVNGEYSFDKIENLEMSINARTAKMRDLFGQKKIKA